MTENKNRPQTVNHEKGRKESITSNNGYPPRWAIQEDPDVT